MLERINVGVVGFGTVGCGTVEVLERNAGWIAQRVGAPVAVKAVADVDWTRARGYSIRPETTD